MAQTITVTVKDGAAVVTTKGFTGSACLNATADLERAMGQTVKDSKTPEFDVKEARVVGA